MNESKTFVLERYELSAEQRRGVRAALTPSLPTDQRLDRKLTGR